MPQTLRPAMRDDEVTSGDFAANLRVLSWNVWAVPWVSPDLERRLRELPVALCRPAPDIIVLQELWEAEFGVRLARALREQGFIYSHHFASTAQGQTGLFVAARFPLLEPSYVPFETGRWPHTAWHLDWLVSKGLARYRLRVAGREIALGNTHLQAQYRTDSYSAERLEQATDIAEQVAQEHAPLILAGDFNSASSDPARRVLRDVAGFDDALPRAALDTILVRDGAAVGLRVRAARLLEIPSYRARNGELLPLSDHAPVFVELMLGTPSKLPLSSAEQARVDATRALREAAELNAHKAWRWGAAAVVLALLTAWVVRRSGWLRRAPTARFRRRILVLGGAFALALGTIWTSYLSLLYYPRLAHDLERAALRFAPPTSRGAE
ncbi:MAG TPA: endonuclease/exonuclease/phosphatase family protein [Polyangiaceae bacterium]|nr:endonuclease/exonuclease/phosphatase family protein [Polyangiaceae bacterium]